MGQIFAGAATGKWQMAKRSRQVKWGEDKAEGKKGQKREEEGRVGSRESSEEAEEKELR